MARIETDPNYTTPTFSRATAGTDAFKMGDIQTLAAALSVHNHDGAGKGKQQSWSRHRHEVGVQIGAGTE